MQACPTHAIMFGNVNDENSKIAQLRAREQKERKYYVLEELHVLSNVNYLVKVRNTDRAVGNLSVDAEHRLKYYIRILWIPGKIPVNTKPLHIVKP